MKVKICKCSIFQQGKELISHKKKQLLAAEMENASKEVMCCIRVVILT